jgi:hypothetical protein
VEPALDWFQRRALSPAPRVVTPTSWVVSAGPAYVEEREGARLSDQLGRVVVPPAVGATGGNEVAACDWSI